MSEDQQIILLLLNGDAAAVASVRQWIRQALSPYKNRFVEEGEDLEQEVLLDLMQSLRQGRFMGQARLATYVRSCVYHKCIDRLRVQKRRTWINVDDLDLPSIGPSPLEEASGKEATEIALKVVAEMPKACQEVWQLLRKGMRYKEMSKVLGVPQGTLRSRVLRCRRKALELWSKFTTPDATNCE